jgi:arylsulfatase A-like enzyme
VIIFIDQQWRDTLDLHGNPLDLTPNLDRAAQSGIH